MSDKPASFWQEIYTLVRSFAKNVVMAKQVKNTIAVLTIFSIRKMEAQLTAIRIPEQPISKRRVILGIWSISFLSNFSRNGQSNLLLVLALALESKGAHY